jgi:hypothetical protein
MQKTVRSLEKAKRSKQINKKYKITKKQKITLSKFSLRISRKEYRPADTLILAY